MVIIVIRVRYLCPKDGGAIFMSAPLDADLAKEISLERSGGCLIIASGIQSLCQTRLDEERDRIMDLIRGKVFGKDENSLVKVQPLAAVGFIAQDSESRFGGANDR